MVFLSVGLYRLIKGRKFIALTVLSLFFLQQIAFAAPGVIKPFNLDSKPKISFEIPDTVATIEDSHLSSTERTIYLIQDAHTNESGQINVSKTLDLILQKENDIRYLFLEAGEGNESLSFLRNLVPLEKRKQVGMSFLRKGTLQGPEYLDLTSNHNITLWGVEDMALYQQAWDAYKTIAEQRNKFQNYLDEIQTTIRSLKPKIYNPILLAFDQKHELFLKEELSLTDYVSALSINNHHYPHLKQLQELKRLEEAIDFTQATQEQDKAIEVLGDLQTDGKPFKLSSQDQKEQKAFYNLLEDKLSDSSSYPELFKYFDYLKEAQKIDAKGILDEQKALETEVFRFLATTQDERDLLKADHHIRDLKNS